MEGKKNRLVWVDVFKGFLIFLVVFGHAVQGIDSNQSLSTNQYYNSISLTKSIIYSFHMGAFFFAGGLFSKNLYVKLDKKYFLKKVKRLVIPYFIWGGVVATCMQLAGSRTNSGLGLVNFLYSPIKPFSIFWFLYVYFFIFCIQCLLVKWTGKKSNFWMIGIGLSLYLLNPFLPNVWILKNLSKYFIFYAIGLFGLSLIKKFEKYFKSWKNIVIELIIFIILFIIYYHLSSNLIIEAYLYFLTGIIGTLFFINISIKVAYNRTLFVKINDLLGRYSMQIYVVHLLPLAFSRIICFNYFHMTNLWIVSGLITLVSLIFCEVVIFITNKFNLSNILFG